MFIDEIYSTPPRRNYPAKRIVSKHNNEIWSIDLADFSDYKIQRKNDIDICLL